MGSLFSSPSTAAAATAGSEHDHSRPVVTVSQEDIARCMPSRATSKETLAAIKKFVDRRNRGLPPYTPEELVACRIHTLVHLAITHYNSNNLSAELEYPAESTTEMKAACIGFRGTFWYHLGFSAHRMEDAASGKQHFFAELNHDKRSGQLAVETCILLEEPLGRFRSSCAFCPDGFNILHPTDGEFVCGKEGHQEEFFREKYAYATSQYKYPSYIDLTLSG